MSNSKAPAQRPATMEEVKARLLKAGKVTEKGLARARQELANDPEIQAARQGESLHVLT